MAQSPYINKVYEYCPAPGQFVNTLPEWEEGDDADVMAQKCTESIANNEQGMISLGGYGGYVVFGFDHTIVNKRGCFDFKVLGNAFYANSNPNAGATTEGGSAEPAIVMVSRDANANGLPDDEWYELAGSEYSKPETIHGYQITYSRSDENKDVVKDPKAPYITDATYCPWSDNTGATGYIYRNSYHKQPYWPQWVDEDEMTFTGTKLACNAIDESGKGTYWVLYCYGFGYADNHPNNDPKNRCSFNIDWAVDVEGNSVALDGIDFVKVYTGVNQYAGWLGETSTEVLGANDLHMTGEDYEDPNTPTTIGHANTAEPESTSIFTISGLRVNAITRRGVYVSKGKKVKIING